MNAEPEGAEGGSGAAVRALDRRDLATILRLVHAEGWGFTEPEVRRLLRHGGGYAVEEDDEVRGLLTCTVYGPLAWVGNVVVAPDARGRGLGTRLVGEALERLAGRGVETVRLYAVLPAVPLYERLGFQEEGRAWSLHGTVEAGGGDPGLPPLTEAHLDAVAAVDAAAFGAPRRELVRDLLDAGARGRVLPGASGPVGYALVRPGDGGSEVGPAVAPAGDASARARLLDAALSDLPPGPCEVGVRSESPRTLVLLRERGFRVAFPAVTMRWGRDAHRGAPPEILAVGGMEKG